MCGIIKFINYVQRNYSKSLFKHYASKTTLRMALEQKMFSKNWNEQTINNTLENFYSVWNSIKSTIKNYSKSEINLLNF